MNDLVAQTAENCIAIIAQKSWERAVDLLDMYWSIGQEIASVAPKQKRKEFIDAVAEKIGREKTSVYYAVQFYEKYPTPPFSNALESLPGGKTPSWREIVKTLPAAAKEEKPKDPCRHCTIHCPLARGGNKV